MKQNRKKFQKSLEIVKTCDIIFLLKADVKNKRLGGCI